MAKSGGKKARKTALRIVALLGVFVLTCCVGVGLFGRSTYTGLQDGLATFDAGIGRDFPDGTVWRIDAVSSTADSADAPAKSLVLVFGVREELPVTESAELFFRLAVPDRFHLGGQRAGAGRLA